MLTDAPGLGKTLQASLASVSPTLIACPTYLVDQWGEFLSEQFPNARVSMAVGSRSNRTAALNTKSDWYIANIEMLRTYDFPKVETFIIDESHHVRGRKSQQAKQALQVAKNTPRVYLLTATPIVKDPDDLFMQLRILDPKSFTSYHKFIDAFCKTITTPWEVKVVGVKNPELLRAVVTRYALGRSYKEVGLQLPPLIEKIVKIRSEELEKTYKKVLNTYRHEDITFDNAQQVIMSLRRMTLCKEKIQGLVECIEDNPNGGAVIFTWFRETAERLAEIFNCPYIHGEMSASERVKVAKSNNFVVATIASLSEGVDLSHLRTVIFFEEDYTPGSMYQALSRVRRYSLNEDPVKMYTIIMKNTIDETVHNCVERRIFNAKLILKEELRRAN